jgi:hypothetical protein
MGMGSNVLAVLRKTPGWFSTGTMFLENLVLKIQNFKRNAGNGSVNGKFII